MNRKSLWSAALAAPALMLMLATTTPAAEPAASPSCDRGELTANSGSGESFHALKPTFLIVAADYEKQADQYATEAERYRTWASAEEMFSFTAFGKRYAVRYFDDKAHELDLAAEQTRTLASQYRHLADAPVSNGC